MSENRKSESRNWNLSLGFLPFAKVHVQKLRVQGLTWSRRVHIWLWHCSALIDFKVFRCSATFLADFPHLPTYALSHWCFRGWSVRMRNNELLIEPCSDCSSSGNCNGVPPPNVPSGWIKSCDNWSLSFMCFKLSWHGGCYVKFKLVEWNMLLGRKFTIFYFVLTFVCSFPFPASLVFSTYIQDKHQSNFGVNSLI